MYALSILFNPVNKERPLVDNFQNYINFHGRSIIHEAESTLIKTDEEVRKQIAAMKPPTPTQQVKNKQKNKKDGKKIKTKSTSVTSQPCKTNRELRLKVVF